MLKKFCLLFVIGLALIVFMVVLTADHEENSVPDDCKIAVYYQEYLDKNPFEYFDYKNIYLDDDTIPELLLDGGCEAMGYLLLSKQGDSVVALNTNRLSFKYIERKGLCGYQSGNMGDYLSEFFKLQDGKFVRYISYQYDDINIPGKVRDAVYCGFYSKGPVIDVADCRVSFLLL